MATASNTPGNSPSNSPGKLNLSSDPPGKTPTRTLIDLETKFWQSMVDQDTETAIEMISEPAIMVTAQGAIKFDRADYREMAKHANLLLTSFELRDIQVMFPNDTTAVVAYHVKQEVQSRGKSDKKTQERNDTTTWIMKDNRWQCVLHTETPAEGQAKH